MGDLCPTRQPPEIQRARGERLLRLLERRHDAGGMRRVEKNGSYGSKQVRVEHRFVCGDVKDACTAVVALIGRGAAAAAIAAAVPCVERSTNATRRLARRASECGRGLGLGLGLGLWLKTLEFALYRSAEAGAAAGAQAAAFAAASAV
jgi:hypothetical protein